MRWCLALLALWVLARLGGLLMAALTAAGSTGGWGAGWLWWLPLDACLLALLLLWLPPWRWLLGFIALSLTGSVMLNLASGVTLAVFGRELNVWLDVALLSAGYQLLSSNLGQPAALLVTGLLLGGLAILAWGMWRLLLSVCRQSAGYSRAWRIAGSAGVAGLILMIWGLDQWFDEPRLGLDAPLASAVSEQAEQLPITLAARQRFGDRQRRQQPDVAPLTELAGRDVVLIFIESYGMSLLERGAAGMPTLLARTSESLAADGIATASGRLRSPVRGGQSWLAHASVLAGLTIDNGLDYRLLLEGQPLTLVQDFAATGHHTMTLMPAITQPWPEGRAYEFDTLVNAAAMDYAGPALNWVTMPDQFTLKSLATRWLSEPSGPVFAQVALVSSHAPWTPILPVRDWASIGDGSGFQPWADAGPPPEQLWRDMAEVQRHYADSVRYSLTVTLEWVARYLPDDALVMVMGDHPAAPVVTGAEASPDVPVHVFSRDAQLIQAFADFGLHRGLMPPSQAADAPMACWRHWLHAMFGAQPRALSQPCARDNASGER
ncbi:alkaline phosphatase [Halomonas sp. 18H]|uniref:alkaline phosphatase n=1 Tax=Halomonas almeriensis TaxID=308163 RepID=UPI00222E3783|nr:MULTISPECIES: alkaline phosphatase [Halomonas]MCW4153037.1 alkaline phosphatase [Halomonas sp. 18H]MDN3554272.1 alkaline phosphatase [Halomonas almeriensis]